MAKPAWLYERQARNARARQDFFQNRTPPESTTIQSKGPQTEVFYRSMILLDGTSSLIFRTSVDAATLGLLSAAEAGLLETLGSDDVATPLKGSGVKPTRLHWYRGTTTPTRRRTDWGTSVARYYDTQGGRSHYSVPFSKTTGVITADDLMLRFYTLFGNGGSKKQLLGAQNGRAHLTWETAVVAAAT